MPPRPAHKRSAASNGEGSSQRNAKKTRFVEPEDDPANFAEEVDSQLENPSAHRKGRVKTEGYDSDSSDDGEGVVLSRRTGEGVAGDDEDHDMFNLEEKEEKENEDGFGGGKKKEEYLRLGDIEGQEFGKKGEDGSDEEDESEEEEEPEDEDDAERRKKAGMGFELSSFNMREEMEEGKFAADGTYVKSFDPHAVHDRWMEGMDEKAIKKARKSHKMQARIEREKLKAEERELLQLGGKDDIEKELIRNLKKGETVLEALQRLGAKAKKRVATPKKRQNNRNKTEDTTMAVDKPPPPKPSSDIDSITHLASLLMSLGETDVYSKTYEELVRSIRSAGKVDRSWEPPSADVKYEYKWDVAGATADDGQVFGPYSEEEMQSWFKASYFGVAGEKIKIRSVGGEWGSWDDIIT